MKQSMEQDRGECSWRTPPEIAKELRVSVEKVHGWIRRGELIAVDVAETPGGRPRYRVRQSDLDDFLLRRTVIPPPKPVPRRRKLPDNVIKFF